MIGIPLGSEPVAHREKGSGRERERRKYVNKCRTDPHTHRFHTHHTHTHKHTHSWSSLDQVKEAELSYWQNVFFRNMYCPCC